MSVSVAAPPPAAKVAMRRKTIVGALVAVALAFGLSVASRPHLASIVGERMGDAVRGVETVAAMLAERSPGERAKGALASLKHKRVTGLHERALPKVRAPSPPISPLAAIVTAPPAPFVVPPTAPLYNLVAGPPVPIPPLGGTTGGGGGGGGPPSFGTITPPGGGGGGVIVPPITTAEVPPPTSAVPEPDTWALMLLGFGLIGAALRRDRRRAALAVTD